MCSSTRWNQNGPNQWQMHRKFQNRPTMDNTRDSTMTRSSGSTGDEIQPHRTPKKTTMEIWQFRDLQETNGRRSRRQQYQQGRLQGRIWNSAQGRVKFDLIPTITTLLERPVLILNVLRDAHSKFLGYELNLAGFVGFLWYNGSIVVGDKTAHVAAVHLPQIFYFSLFFAAFSSSHVLGTFRRVVRFALKRWYVSCFCVGLFLCVIQVNTIVHPYLLADNRHYTFYIWMRFYQRWTFAKFLPVPIYYGILVLLGLILFTRGQGGQTVGFSLLWMLATLASVALQQLIEVRYFILPFLVLRLLQTNVQSSTKLLALEVLANVLINAATFYIFCTKAVYWSDYTEPQRIIW